jgi:hypothetical protein
MVGWWGGAGMGLGWLLPTPDRHAERGGPRPARASLGPRPRPLLATATRPSARGADVLASVLEALLPVLWSRMRPHGARALPRTALRGVAPAAIGHDRCPGGVPRAQTGSAGTAMWPDVRQAGTTGDRCVCVARATSAVRSRTCGRLYSYETLLKRLAQGLEDVAPKLGPFIQEEDAVVGPRHLARHRHVTTADQPCIREGLVGRATRARRDQRRAVAGEAGDAVDAGGVDGFGEAQRRQDRGQPARPPRLPRPPVGPEGSGLGRNATKFHFMLLA